jgi:hypothetical protein
MKIPAQGIVGEVALREAVTEYRAIIEAVRAALGKLLSSPDRQDPWVCIEAIYPDRAIIEWNGGYWQYPYTLADDGTVSFGAAVQVVEEYVPMSMKEAVRTAFVEAAPDAQKRFLIRAIRSGLSLNGVFYSDTVLREAAPLFEGARVFVKSDEEHIKGGGKSFNQLIGRLVEAKFVAGAMPDCGEVRAKLELIQPDGEVGVKLREAVANKMSDLFGFSIDADGTAKFKVREGKRVKEAQSITKISSVDLIVEPGAGGQLIRLVEAVQSQTEDTEMALRERMIEAVKAANKGALPANLNVDDDAALEAAYREAVQPKAAPAPAPAAVDLSGVQEQIRMVEARAVARATIAASTLPQAAKDKLLGDFAVRASFTEADVSAAIEGERAYLAKFTEAGHIAGLGDGRAEPGADFADQCKTMLDDFFSAKAGGPTSFKECYAHVTGDARVTGRFQNCDPVRLREAAGASYREAVSSNTFTLVLGDAIHRALIADYRQSDQYSIWRQATGTPVPISDFRTNHRTRFGGYGDVPKVAERAAYQPMSTPSDEEVTYAIEKRGGTESVSLEAIRNDDVGVIRRIPTNLSRAAKRTLAKFVLEFMRTNPVIYDGKALFHADHGNLGTLALSANAIAAARLAMLNQAPLGVAEPLGIAPRNLWVPYALEQTAADLFRRDTNLDETFVQQLKPTIIPVWYWTDANDWCFTADPMDIPFIELGFLDGNEEPELFVQDSPTLGSLFSNDVITYKLRHIYGGNVLDYRGAYKAVVA